MLRKISIILLISLFVACTAQPINPENNQPLISEGEKMDHEQKVAVQEEVIKRQEMEKTRQERDYLELKKQEYYNYRAERFKK